MSLLDGLEDEVESVLFVVREISCRFRSSLSIRVIEKPPAYRLPPMETMEGYKVGPCPRIESPYNAHASGCRLGIGQPTMERTVAHFGEGVNWRNDLA